MGKRELTPNQKLFCEEYAIDRNGTRAYKAAYKGIKRDKVAQVNASRLLSNATVSTYVGELLDKISKKAEISAEMVLKEEGRLAFSDLRQIFDGETTLPPSELPDDIAAAVAGIKVRTRSYGQPEDRTTETTYEYKLWDKGAALNRIEKYLGMHQADKLDVDGIAQVAEKILEARKRASANC